MPAAPDGLPSRPPDTPPARPALRGLSFRIVRFGLPLALILLGFGLSLTVRMTFEPAESIATTGGKADIASHGSEVHSPPHPFQPPRHPIDLAIVEGRYDAALEACDARDAEKGWATAYRRGLIYEGLEDRERARTAFAAAAKLAGEESQIGGWAGATIGLARCDLAKRDWDAAAQSVERVRLRSGHPHCRTRGVYQECVRLAARIALGRFGDNSTPDPLAPYAFAPPVWKDDPALTLERFPATAAPPVKGRETSPITVSRSESGKWLVSGRSDRIGFEDLFTLLSRESAVVICPDPDVQTYLAGQFLSLDVAEIPLDELLRATIEPFGMTTRWAAGSAAVEIRTRNDSAEGKADGESARTALQRLIELSPKDSAAAIGLANGLVRAGEWFPAASAYRRILNESSDPVALTTAGYNLGLVFLHLGHAPLARDAFHIVVDADQSPRWKELGLWWVARSSWEAGEADAAVIGFRSGLASDDRTIRSASALGLVACQLLDDDTPAALTTLDRFRIGPGIRYDALGRAFRAWCLYRSSPTANRKRLLVDDLNEARDATDLGPLGVFLVGRIYSDLGRPEKTVALYEEWVGRVRGPLAVTMTNVAAGAFDRAGNVAAAKSRYQAVAAADAGPEGTAARLRLAEYELLAGSAVECLEWCRALRSARTVDSNRLNRVMGRAYEALGQYDRAAACFAGRPPP